MRLAIDNKRLVALIILIGVLGVAFSLVCSEGIHLPFVGDTDGKCAVMTHSAVVDAVLGSESSHTLVSPLITLVVGLLAFSFLFEAPARFVLASASPSPPPDPRFGRLRI